nr:MAG TPA: ubiquitin-binding zinc finger protein [Caudoviricetes sp.]
MAKCLRSCSNSSCQLCLAHFCIGFSQFDFR